jgi:hypothetical protein
MYRLGGPDEDDLRDMVEEADRRALCQALAESPNCVHPRQADLVSGRLVWRTANTLTLSPPVPGTVVWDLTYDGFDMDERWRAVRATETETNGDNDMPIPPTPSSAAPAMATPAMAAPTMADAAIALVAQEALIRAGGILVDLILSRLEGEGWWARLTARPTVRAMRRWLATDMGQTATAMLGAAALYGVATYGPGAQLRHSTRVRRIAESALRADGILLLAGILRGGALDRLVEVGRHLAGSVGPAMALLTETPEDAEPGAHIREVPPVRAGDRW